MQKIIDKITQSEEIINSFPKTDVGSLKHFINEANRIYAEYNLFKTDLIQEMKQRVINFENSIKSEPISPLKTDDLEEELNLLNKLNSPYEKLGLSEIFYDLSKYYKFNFESFSEYLFKLIDIFREVGINLEASQFYYNKDVNIYMEKVLNITDRNTANEGLKGTFEQSYWQNPNIIRDIKLNFKSLYFKYEKSFEDYIKKLQVNLKRDSNQVIKEYHSRLVVNQQNMDTNKAYQVERFKNKELNIKAYDKANILKIADSLIKGDPLEYPRVIYNFKDSLEEYKNYLQVKEIIDKLSTIYQESSAKKEKLEPKKKLKEIKKLERSLLTAFKRNKKILDDSYSKIDTLYEEYEDLSHQEALLKTIKAESKISDAISFLIAYYSYYLKLSKDSEAIRQKKALVLLKKLYLNPYSTLINNLYLLREYDLSMIILDKYKLDNLILDDLSLDEETIDELITKTEYLCNYYKIANLQDFNLEDIEGYLSLKELLNSLEQK